MTAQSSPMPAGAPGEVDPNQREISRIRRDSPQAETDSDLVVVKGFIPETSGGGERASCGQALTPAMTSRMVFRLNRLWATIGTRIDPVRS